MNNEITNYLDFREYVIDCFIKKYNNSDKVVAYLLRECITSHQLETESKFLCYMVNWGMNDFSSMINDYPHLSGVEDITINKITGMIELHSELNFDIRLMPKEEIIYINLDAVKRKYKIRNLIDE